MFNGLFGGVFPPAGGRRNAGHLLLLGLMGLCALLAARLLVAAAAPLAEAPPPMRLPPADPSALSRLDPFGGATAPEGGEAATALPLTLHGVRRDAASGRGTAIIATEDGTQAVYEVGDGVGGARLAAIAADHVLLDNGGRRERLGFDNGAAGGAAPAPAPPAAPPATAVPAAAPASAALQPTAPPSAVRVEDGPPDMLPLPDAAPEDAR